MIYLRTGANGAGKTLLTLRDVQAKSLAENRPVFYNGRFKVVPGGPLDKWTIIEAKNWQSVPDGAIFVFDECHNDFPVRSSKEPAPDYVRMLAEHRARGFDFYLITQHPLNIDAFVRRLIGSPGWHQHLKRSSGTSLVSVLQWSAVNEVCQKNGSGASGDVSTVLYPKEVYGWYTSTSLDTAKTKIPFQVKVLVVMLVVVPVLGYFAWQTVTGKYRANAVTPSALAGLNNQPGSPGGAIGRGPMTPLEYVKSFEPRLAGMAYSAPRYDSVTQAAVAPYPAACITSKSAGCRCFSQQGTKLDVQATVCDQIVKGGFFMDWEVKRPDVPVDRAESVQVAPGSGAVPVVPARKPAAVLAKVS